MDPRVEKWLSKYTRDLRYFDNLQHQGLVGVVRLQRNTVAATLRFMDLLLGKGFKFPGLSSRKELVEEIKSVLKYDDELYREKLEEYGKGLTFS